MLENIKAIDKGYDGFAEMKRSDQNNPEIKPKGLMLYVLTQYGDTLYLTPQGMFYPDKDYAEQYADLEQATQRKDEIRQNQGIKVEIES